MKLAVPEPGASDAIAAWLRADRVVSSLLLYPEARSALGRAIRSRRLVGGRERRARRLLERLWADVGRVGVSASLAVRAGELAEEHRLRAYDAVHLASLEAVGDAETVLVSADLDLVRAAGALGFATVRAG